MVPYEGRGRGTPRPRKLRAASAITPDPTPRVVSTRSVVTIFGKMCRIMI